MILHIAGVARLQPTTISVPCLSAPAFLAAADSLQSDVETNAGESDMQT